MVLVTVGIEERDLEGGASGAANQNKLVIDQLYMLIKQAEIL